MESGDVAGAGGPAEPTIMTWCVPTTEYVPCTGENFCCREPFLSHKLRLLPLIAHSLPYIPFQPLITSVTEMPPVPLGVAYPREALLEVVSHPLRDRPVSPQLQPEVSTLQPL